MTPCRATLRPYPRNSPEAAARIVALAPIANGRIKAAEAAVPDALHADHALLEPVLYGADFEVRPRGRAPSEVRLPRVR
jgi:hypothetical protein